MGDFNAPIPPMGADENGMDDQMGLGDPMGVEPPMGDGTDDMGNEPLGNGEDDELMNIINNLSIEDKAAVTKYAKSMADDSNGNEMPQEQDAMPMESMLNLKNVIDETINDVLDNREGAKRKEKKIPKEYKKFESPFKSPF